MVYTISFPIVLRLIFPLWSFPLNFSIIKSVVCLFFFFKKKICWTHVHFWGHWYPCFELLVMSPLGFKARVGSLIQAWWRRTSYTFPEIYLWCDTCWPLGGQHGSRAVSSKPVVCQKYRNCIVQVSWEIETCRFSQSWYLATSITGDRWGDANFQSFHKILSPFRFYDRSFWGLDGVRPPP